MCSEVGSRVLLRDPQRDFKEALGAFDCVADDVIQRIDVSIVIGVAVATRVNSSRSPLVFFRGEMRSDFQG